MYRGGLDRFKKAQSLEPFSVSSNSKSAAAATVSKFGTQNASSHAPINSQQSAALRLTTAKESSEPAAPANSNATQVGGGQSTWQPPDWAIEPLPGMYYLEVLKDGEVIDRINLDKRRHIFGRQLPTCDFVLDHQSVSRQHAAVVPHKNGSIFVIDLGSVHGTFVANERLTRESPVELEVGQSLRFAASTRSYVLRKNVAAVHSTPSLPADFNLPSPPDPNDEDGVVAYNTLLNRHGINKSDLSIFSKGSSGPDDTPAGRPSKRSRKLRVAFRDQAGGELVQVVGISDGVDVETEPGPMGVKEGSLVGKYESLIQTTVIPKGKDQHLPKESILQKGVTDKLQQVLNRVKSSSKGGFYDDILGDSFPASVGSSWAQRSDINSSKPKDEGTRVDEKLNLSSADDNDDLFGDS